MKSIWDNVLARNTLDARALGLFRIALGLLLVIRFWGTVPRNFAHIYSPSTGLLGNCFAKGYQAAYKTASPLFSIETDGAMWAFVITTGLVMFLFMLGFYPRIMALVGSILLWLFNDRFQMVWFGWEQYVQVLLFLCILVPTDLRFTLFRSRTPDANSSDRVAGPYVFLLLFQIAFIYFFNGISKNGDKWLDGSAVQFALGGIERQLPAGDWLLHQDGLSTLLSYGSLGWELLFPLLLFFPTRSHWPRSIAALSVLGFHWSLSLFMDVGDFKFVAIAVCLLLLPSELYRRLPTKLLDWAQRGIKLPAPRITLPKWFPLAVASLLVTCIVFANLKQSLLSKNEDRMKGWLGGTTIGRLVVDAMPNGLPRFSFFTQHWHLFSPDPPSELGYIRVEVQHEDGAWVTTFAGEEGLAQLPTKNLRFLMQYLSYDRKNVKAEVFASCLGSWEAHLWHEAHPGVHAQRLAIALYTWRPETVAELQEGPAKHIQRVELLGLKFDYAEE